MAEAEYRLDPRRDVVGEQRDRPGRRDRGDQRIADAVPGDLGPHLVVEATDRLAGEIAVAVEQRERALFGRERRAGVIGETADRRDPALRGGDRLRRTVTQP